MNPLEEVNVETLFNLYGIVAILCYDNLDNNCAEHTSTLQEANLGLVSRQLFVPNDEDQKRKEA